MGAHAAGYNGALTVLHANKTAPASRRALTLLPPTAAAIPTAAAGLQTRTRVAAKSTASPAAAATQAATIQDLPDPLLLQIVGAHPQACFDCAGLGRALRRACLAAAPALAAQPWALCLAAEGGHVSILRALLDAGAQNSAELAAHKRTALARAAGAGAAEAVRLLLERGVGVDDSHMEYSALYQAAINGHAEVVEALLAAGARVAGLGNRTALLRAAEGGHTEVVQALLAVGTSLNQAEAVRRRRWAPLRAPSPAGQPKPGALLLRPGDDPALDEWDHRTALHFAAEQGNATMVQVLLQAGIEVLTLTGRWGLSWTALHAAAAVGRAAMVRQLLQAGADPNAKDGQGYSPLHDAVLNGDAATVQALLDGGATVVNALYRTGRGEPRARRNFNGVRARRRMPDGLHCSGESVLHYAAHCGHAEVMQALLAAGGDPAAATRLGLRPLHYAAAAGRVEVVRLLLDAGNDVNSVEKYGRTALHYAARSGGGATVRALLSAGADAKRRDERQGWAALHHAVLGGQEESVRALIGAGADVHAEDDAGKTPLALASSLGANRESIACMLRAAGVVE
jgi:cytohesin